MITKLSSSLQLIWEPASSPVLSLCAAIHLCPPDRSRPYFLCHKHIILPNQSQTSVIPFTLTWVLFHQELNPFHCKLCPEWMYFVLVQWLLPWLNYISFSSKTPEVMALASGVHMCVCVWVYAWNICKQSVNVCWHGNVLCVYSSVPVLGVSYAQTLQLLEMLKARVKPVLCFCTSFYIYILCILLIESIRSIHRI
jgi:hypothetical protein